MKPARELIIGKSGEETLRFNPTSHMILFAIEKAKTPGEADPAIAARAGINQNHPAGWARKYGTLYLEWIDEFVEHASFTREAEVLEAIGMVSAIQGSYQHWRDMAKKHGVIADEPKEIHVTLNTNFDVILAQGDLKDARRRLLQEVRGLGEPGKPRVVDVTPSKDSGGFESPGSGARNMQGGPLALPSSLGSDGGQSEPGRALPTVPERPSPTSLDRILAKKAVPPRPKK